MINITDEAKSKLIAIMDEEKVPAVRFGLQGGGCSGFTYTFTLEGIISEDDFQIDLDGSHKMVVDPMSGMYLEGSTVDFKSDLNGDTFLFDNPNAKSKCGCGNSADFG